MFKKGMGMEFVIERNGERIVLTNEEVEEIFQKKDREDLLADVTSKIEKDFGSDCKLLKNPDFLENVANCHDTGLSNSEDYWKCYWNEMEKSIKKVLPGVITLEIYDGLPADNYRDYSLAKDKRTCADVLARLSNSEFTMVRYAVAANPNTSLFNVTALSKDADERVAEMAKMNLEKRQKKTLNEKMSEASENPQRLAI